MQCNGMKCSLEGVLDVIFQNVLQAAPLLCSYNCVLSLLCPIEKVGKRPPGPDPEGCDVTGG